MSAFWRVQQDFRPLDALDRQIEIREGSEDHGAHGIIVSLQSVNQSIMWQRCSRISLHGNFPRQEPSIEIRDLDTQILDFF